MDVGIAEIDVLRVFIGGDIPLVRALLKVGIPTIAVYFKFDYEFDGKPKRSFINPRLERAVAYTLNVTELAKDDPQRLFEQSPESPEMDRLP